MKLQVDHIVKGQVVKGADREYGNLLVPALDLDTLIWSRPAKRNGN